MLRIYSSAAAEPQMCAQSPSEGAPNDQPTDQKTKARAIIEAQLAKKKGSGVAHGPQHEREGKAGKVKGQFAAPPTRPGQRGRRG